MGLEQLARYAVSVAATVLTTPMGSPVTISNVSQRGCRFTSSDRIPVGTFTAIRIGRAPPIGGCVEWRAGNNYGMRFEREMHLIVLDHVRWFVSEPPALEPERIPDYQMR